MPMNRLSQEKSPYLLQHKNNPVWWFPWGKEAFDQAQKEDKPIFLSVGYSTCHWCHVMEKDSFEKDDVAQVLNKDFVAIKVDREERPDVDSLYMNAVQAMTARGGWPMSVLLTSDGQPFWGGTFIPHDELISLLTRVSELWKTQKEEILQSGESLARHLKGFADLPRAESPGTFNETSLVRFYEAFQKRFDPLHGGNQGAPKFPPTLALRLLLRIHRRTGNANALHMVEKTLSSMRRGGIYDQLGGGFHRYSVDDHWFIPHFEKMLYDNAQLAAAHLELFQVTGKEEYGRTAREILDYVLRDMTDKTGGFYSAEDADSENIEGKFYVWPEDELKDILSPGEFQKIKLMFQLSGDKLFHAHKTGTELTVGPHTPPALTGFVLHLDPSSPLPDLRDPTIRGALKKMEEARSRRVRPHLDDKILTGWNGLMISAMAQGFQALGETRYLEAASGAAEFVLKKMRSAPGRLLKRFRDGEAGQPATADDYAFFIEALLHLYQSDFDSRWFVEARSLQKIQDDIFWDQKAGAYFDSDGSDPFLILRQKTFEDNVVPSPNSVSCSNLLRLFSLTGDMEYRRKALSIISAAGTLTEKYPTAVSKLLDSVDRLTEEAPEVAVASHGGDSSFSDFLKKVRTSFQPHLTLAVKSDSSSDVIPLLQGRAEVDHQTTFYVCREMTCELPRHGTHEVFGAISKPKTYQLI